MSAILNDAMKYIDQSQKGYLVMTDEFKKICIIKIDEFISNYADIYFIVDKDVKKMKIGSKVNIYFKNNVQKKCSVFKSIRFSGKLDEIVYSNESYMTLKALISKKRGRNYNVYKLKLECVNLCDYIKPLQELKEII
ncbi:hypothetical protein ACSVC9_07795 [Clostridium sp. LBM24168]